MVPRRWLCQVFADSVFSFTCSDAVLERSSMVEDGVGRVDVAICAVGSGDGLRGGLAFKDRWPAFQFRIPSNSALSSPVNSRGSSRQYNTTRTRFSSGSASCPLRGSGRRTQSAVSS
jgi:hypothetical protein